jgi:hypothetical protein
MVGDWRLAIRDYGLGSVGDFLGDFVVYRNLTPMDPRLPSLEELSRSADIPSGRIPRKLEREYARVMVEYLRQARQLVHPGVVLRKLLYIGDTRLNDGKAFANLRAAGGWRGLAFIASEDDKEEHVDIEEQDDQTLYLANRWSALRQLDTYCGEVDFHVDEETVVVIDLDKTAIGARGRNDQVINQARIEAVKGTLVKLVGEAFSLADFQMAYDLLNQPEFHPLTEDNQDYLAYICMILSSDLWNLNALVDEWRQGRISSFQHFLELVGGSKEALSEPLQAIHDEVLTRTREGDPTPFKDFRRTEYLTTVGRMGVLGEGVSVERLLGEEILITAEVKQVAELYADKGALLFGLSDKPDEASVPSREQAEVGYQPIHWTTTHIVGS